MDTDKTLDVDIVTPEQVFFSGKAGSVTVPGVVSPFQILYNHAPIVSSLELGIVKVLDESGVNNYFATSGGFVEVRKNQVSILVEDAASAASIDMEQTQKELSEAIEMLEKEKSAKEIEGLKKKIGNIQNRLKAGQAYKS